MIDTLEYLFGLEQTGIKFGLDNVRVLASRLGHPERAYRVVHVAGTNGKGSVTAMIEAALRASGCRAARYTSPHLIDIRERFVVGGRPVAQASLDEAIADLRREVDALLAAGALAAPPSFFEAATVVAFELFRRAEVDIAVFEVGLGGRLDATNIVRPEVTAITSIAHDHEQYLGSTLGEIAGEKAGIIKSRVPIVVGPVQPDAAEVIESVARQREAPLVRAWEGVSAVRRGDARIEIQTPNHDYGPIALALRGRHQIDNAVVAVRVLELAGAPSAAIIDGLERVSWPGRLDTRGFPGGREALFDAAHNPAGAAALASYLADHSGDGPRPLVFGAMRDKDLDGMFRALLPWVGAVVLTRASTPRAADPDTLADRVRAILAEPEPGPDSPDQRPILVEPRPRRALDAAWQFSRRVVVAGSIFLLGDLLREEAAAGN